MSRHSTGNLALSVTIRADDVYREYAQDEDPQKLFDKAAGWIQSMQNTPMDDHKRDIISEEIDSAMIRAIFGSNMIERAGLNLDITIQLCKKIFAGEDVHEFLERDPDCQQALLAVYSKHHDLSGKSAQFIIRGRSEIVQHAKAYRYLIHQFVVEREDLSEDLIKKTHHILTQGIPIIRKYGPDVQPESYGGIYRSLVVGAGNCNFTVPRFIPTKMAEMCSSIKKDLDSAEEKGYIDPFSIAAKYSLEFVHIHPFGDGNGRICRMILNTILCRFAGVIVPIGEHDEERTEYMRIKKRSSEDMDGHGEYAMFVLKRATTRLREIKKKIAGKEVLAMRFKLVRFLDVTRLFYLPGINNDCDTKVNSM